MFTGIVETVGGVVDVSVSAAARRLRIAASFAETLRNGDSVAVNGVCLTVVDRSVGEFSADVGPETARVTTLNRLAVGHRVNLERPVRLNGRLDGHLVLGHVDDVGCVTEVREDADAHLVRIRFPDALAPYFIPKGSVAVDGVSLTIAALAGHSFDLQIVPYTWTHTTFERFTIGDMVNLECDMIGKYVVRALGLAQRPPVRS